MKFKILSLALLSSSAIARADGVVSDDEPGQPSDHAQSQRNANGESDRGVDRQGSAAPIEVTSLEQFRSLTENSTKPVVLDFGATWCHYCTLLSPKLDELAKKYAGKVTFLKIDIDKVPPHSLPKPFDGVDLIPQVFLAAPRKKPSGNILNAGGPPAGYSKSISDYRKDLIEAGLVKALGR